MPSVRKRTSKIFHRYVRLDQSYVVYSVDRDEQDDGERESPLRIVSPDTNAYDLTFIVER